MDTKFGAFYTGGTVAWTNDGAELLCQDQHRINVISVEGNTAQRSIADVAESVGADALDVDAMYTFALGADDAHVVSSHKSGLLKLWQRNDGALLQQWKAIHQGPVPRLTFNADSTLIASGGTDASVRLWNATKRVCLGALRGCQGVISVLAFQSATGSDSDYGVLVAAGDDHRIHVWSVETRELRHVLSGHFSRITAVSFASAEWLVSAGRDKVLMLWNLADGKMVRTVPTYESLEGVVALSADAVVPEGKLISVHFFGLIVTQNRYFSLRRHSFHGTRIRGRRRIQWPGENLGPHNRACRLHTNQQSDCSSRR